jgi:hypothetical protein
MMIGNAKSENLLTVQNTFHIAAAILASLFVCLLQNGYYLFISVKNIQQSGVPPFLNYPCSCNAPNCLLSVFTPFACIDIQNRLSFHYRKVNRVDKNKICALKNKVLDFF